MRYIKLLLIAATLFTNSKLFSAEIDSTKATQLAINFLSKFQSQNFSINDIENIVNYNHKGLKVFYIVNFKNSVGFVIVPNETASQPILGFVPNHKFDFNQWKPQNFMNLLSDYAQQIEYIQQKNIQPTKEIIDKWEQLTSSHLQSKGPTQTVAPLLTSIWSQGCFFNDSTPSDPGGPCQNAVTGCVATAMGQVLNYHQFPPNGSGLHSYQSNYGWLTANFGATSYAWNLMPDTLDANSSAAEVAAVSQLLGHCGVAVDMMYSSGSSGAYSEDAMAAFTHYFNYETGLQMLYRDNYSDSIWKEMVMHELDSLRPLYYDGTGSGGHAFVCDGYQNGDYFHFNWGWNGSLNGWFLLTNLNPGSMNFSMYNSAIFGLKPQLPSGCQNQTAVLNLPTGHINDGSSYSNYGDNLSCNWLIQPANAVSLSISFYTFQLAFGDTLFIYDGNNSNAPLLGALTGNILPNKFNTSSNAAFIVFKTDNLLNAQGWSATYRSDFCEGNTILNAPFGQISDGSGSNLYNNNTDCSWLINSPTGAPIKLIFDEFNTEAGFDYVKIYDGSTTNSTLIGSFDGQNLPPTTIANSGQMLINFISDGGVVDQGWLAHYFICDSLPLPVSSSGHSFCYGDSISLSAPLFADSIIWLKNNTALATDSTIFISLPGSYSYIVYRSNCSIDTSKAIQIQQLPTANPDLGADFNICLPTSGSFISNPFLPLDSSNFNYTSYLWNTGSTTQLLYLNDLLPNLIADSTYLFTVEVIDFNGCLGRDSIFINFESCLSMEEFSQTEFVVFPNPFTHFINYQTNDINCQIKIYSISGQLVLEEKVESRRGKIAVNHLKSGVYILQITNSKSIYNQQLIKL